MKGCLNPENKRSKVLNEDYISLNGIDFFPQEFCTQGFLQNQLRRNTMQLKKFSSPTKTPRKKSEMVTDNDTNVKVQANTADNNIYSNIF